MVTGLELAGLVLATFPLVISGLEHYENGFQCIKEWIRFRVEFSKFLNALCRQKIFFRQNIESLLSAVVTSEYEMAQLLDNPVGEAWKDSTLNEKLKARLPGMMEYECYMATVQSLFDILEKLKVKLKIVDGQVHWTEAKSSSKKLRWEFELKRINYTFGLKRREKLMLELEKHNSDIQNLLGNSERLEPMRRSRKSNIPKFFQRIRNEACILHSTLDNAWRCDCRIPHATKLLLETRVNGDQKGSSQVRDALNIRFSVLFCPELVPVPDWCSTEIMLAETDSETERRSSYSPELGRRSSLATDIGSKAEMSSLSTWTSRSTRYSRASDASSRNVSFIGEGLESPTSSVPTDGLDIIDLCSALKQRSKAQKLLGFLRNGREHCFTIDMKTKAGLDTATVVTLEALLASSTTPLGFGDSIAATMSRRNRLEIAVVLANSLLQLHSGPWLPESWSKKDIYFFRSSNGQVLTEHPFVLSQFHSRKAGKSELPSDTKVSPARPPPRTRNQSLLSLGIVVLELWFNKSMEDLSYRKDFLGPDGKENEFTDFNTAQKWQETTMEEAGPDLYNPTRRCLYCAFGAASQDLEDDELRRAVYSEVVQPLERLLGRFVEVTSS